MQQRFVQGFDYHLVRFGVVAFGREGHGPAEPDGYLADQARKTLENLAKREDAKPENGLLQFPDQKIELVVLILQSGSEAAPAIQRELRGVSDRILRNQ